MAEQNKDVEEDSYSQGMFYFSSQHSDALRANVEAFRVNANYTDVTIIIEDKKFPCHRAILAAGSYYFKSMFSSGMEETHKNSFTIKQIDPLVFGHVLHFIYTGSITITTGIVFELFSQSHMFQISTLVELCVQFFKEEISDSNCLCALSLSDAHAHKELYEFTKEYACKHFTSLIKDEDFLRLSGECVIDLLNDRRLNCTTESQVFEAAVKWLEYDIEHRKSFRYQMMTCVKFPLIAQSYLLDYVIKSNHMTCEKGQEMIEDAISFHTVPSRRNLLQAYQITPRFAFSYTEVAVLLGGRVADGLSSDVEFYRPDTKEFVSLKPLPFKKRNEYAAAVIGNEIYVSGGLRSPELWKYDLTFHSWIRGNNMLQARRRHAMAVVDNNIYVLGGFDEECVLNTVEMWDSSSNKWTSTGKLLFAVENMGYVAYGKYIYLFGGKNNDEVVTNVVQCYDTTTHTCSIVKNGLPANDMCLSAVVLNSQIYVVGLEGVFRYTPLTGNWDILPEMRCARDFVSLAVLDEKIYLFGGRCRGSKENLYSDLIEVYNSKDNSWDVVGKIPVPMYSYGCVKIFLSQTNT
ncbi:kelch-like protein 24 isoform X2 [Octopus bimaculoides]|nr:kelch-like protein 24 isoform X2 [Octopus bimaculoides]XP_014783350.1 kelch-like protein 24 isoform X2 [Octopus bimaculoides]XP_014783351.1 kelch-like protein 24 isoform X2 [Octopus bimaculoides]XP_014783352.1 kelch-like protein 24 isoform X2 [Octopus bimaculoides]XP_052823440.1 kelch-like protein 24 isoform X2 [Octopus bimaculoides]|eukprot:XP_014783349.1 PREDICTED: kelch-like protein 24 isoform X2 [Octopus bimaculoides]